MANDLKNFIKIWIKNYKLPNSDFDEEYLLIPDPDFFMFLKFIGDYHNMGVALMVFKELRMFKQEFYEQLFSEGYITDEITEETWSDYANAFLTVDDLKKILRNNNLKVSGRKQELIDRIKENDINFNYFVTDQVFLTGKAKDYLAEFSWIELYKDHLNDFNFKNFYIFYTKNDGDFKDIASKYLDEHIKIAKNNKEFIYMIDCIDCKSAFADLDNNIKEELEWEMLKYCLCINPVYQFDPRFRAEFLLIKDNIKKLLSLESEFSKKEILDVFDESWDYFEFDEFFISKKDAKVLLERLIFNHEDFKAVDTEITDKFKNSGFEIQTMQI